MSKAFVSFVLDESGSMDLCRGAAISGFNEYVTDLKRQGADIALTLTKFNTGCTVVYVGKPVAEVEPLSEQTYTPNGMTALYDAIAATVRAVDTQAQWGDRILVVMLTDGQENSSKETTREQVKALIQGKEAAGNWTFVYLAANQDAWAAGHAIGTQSGNIASFQSTPAGTQAAMRSVSAHTAMYAAAAAPQTSSFFDPKDKR